MWDLPGPGLEPVSPALAGGFLTTVPPGKSPVFNLNFAPMDMIYLAPPPPKILVAFKTFSFLLLFVCFCLQFLSAVPRYRFLFLYSSGFVGILEFVD